MSLSQEGLGTYRLRYTGTLGEAEFAAVCQQQPWWYHSYFFDNGFEVRGDYDIGATIDDYGFPDLDGLTVLDIGTGAGWFAHYFHQHGAKVTSVDLRGYEDFDVYGQHEPAPSDLIGRPPDRHDANGDPIYFSPVSGGFWLMKEILGSDIEFKNSRVYDVGPELFDGRRFDLVFMGAVLCHLRDPIGALMAARRVCGGRIIASTPVVLGEPAGETLPRQYLPYTDMDNISWWLPNEACFRHWFLAAGFADVDISRTLTLRGDVEHCDEKGRVQNGDQIHRVGHAGV